jgi:hypothetical protein
MTDKLMKRCGGIPSRFSGRWPGPGLSGELPDKESPPGALVIEIIIGDASTAVPVGKNCDTMNSHIFYQPHVHCAVL